MAARALSQNDLTLLGYGDSKLIEQNPYFHVYSAQAVAGLTTIQGRFIYLTSLFRNEDARAVSRFIDTQTPTFVVLAQSLNARQRKISDLLGSQPEYHLHENVIWSKVKSTFGKYLESLESGVQPPSPYVTPHPLGQPNTKLDELIIQWLQDHEASSSVPIRAIRAPAGVGKTSLARKLVRKIVEGIDRYRLIPVFVEAEHWARLRVETLDDLWSMINNSLHHFHEELQVSRPLFEHLLRAGHIAFIFDGFDELCGHSRAILSPRDVLQELEELGRESAAKIVLTTRTAYWNAEVGQQPAFVEIVDLAEFTKPQALDTSNVGLQRIRLKESAP